jgi:hypothetical protein
MNKTLLLSALATTVLAASLGVVADAQVPNPMATGQAEAAQPVPMQGPLPFQIRLAGPAIPQVDATLILYRTIVGAENSGTAEWLQDIRESLRTDAAPSTSTIFDHMKATIDDVDGFRRLDISTSLCAKRNEIATRQELIDVLLQIDSRTDAHRAIAVSTGEVVLGKAAKRDLDVYVQKFRSGMVWLKTDPAKYVEYSLARGKSVSELIAKMCDK